MGWTVQPELEIHSRSDGWGSSFLAEERSLLPPAKVQQLSPAALAYLGDAVYELYVRTRLLLPPKQVGAYHQQVVAQVRAEKQAGHLRSLQPYLTKTELDVVRQGRNAAFRGPKRLDPVIYRQASSFETLVGFLYLTDRPRLELLCQQLELTDLRDGDSPS